VTGRYAGSAAAVILSLLCYGLARLPTLTSAETAAQASRYRFDRLRVPEGRSDTPHKSVREVHPSLARISAWVSSLGAAATLADLDGDGLPNDLVLVDPRTDAVTVAPAPGTPARYEPFALDETSWSGDAYDRSTLAPMGTLAGDFNEDGAIDLLVYFWGRTPILYLHRSDATTAGLRAAFVPQDLVPSGDRWYSNSALQADLDGDGHVDLLIGNYYPDGARVLDPTAQDPAVMQSNNARALNGGHEHFFLWRAGTAGAAPAVRYQEVQGVLAEEVSRGWTLAMGAADLDGDLLPELYLANDFGPDRLLHNRSSPGNLRFAVLEGRRGFTTPKSCVVGRDSFKGMGVDFGDVNGDGILDIYVSNIATRYGLTESHFLWMSTGALEDMKRGIAPYVHASETLGLARSGFCFDARLADFDNDGSLEAMQACGFIEGTVNRWPELQSLGTSNDQIIDDPRLWPSFEPGADLSGHDPHAFFVRAADGRYYDMAPGLGLAEPMVGRGIAIADVDGDGRLDFVTANQWGPSFLFRNQAPDAGAFLALRLVDANGAPAIGTVARVSLPDGRRLVAQVDGGNGHSGHRSPEVHFGLGAVEATRELAVALSWRDRDGQPREATLSVLPGRQTVELAAVAQVRAPQHTGGE
jgi:enediyne biosynthesis protein E4